MSNVVDNSMEDTAEDTMDETATAAVGVFVVVFAPLPLLPAIVNAIIMTSSPDLLSTLTITADTVAETTYPPPTLPPSLDLYST